MTTADLTEVETAEQSLERVGLRRLLTVPEAALYLGVSERWLYDEVREGRLRAMYIARSWRIRPQILDEYAESFVERQS